MDERAPRLLVVDDEDALVDMLRDALRFAGYEVHTASRGFDALRKHYPPRREIDGLRVELLGQAPQLAALVRALGARLV